MGMAVMGDNDIPVTEEEGRKIRSKLLGRNLIGIKKTEGRTTGEKIYRTTMSVLGLDKWEGFYSDIEEFGIPLPDYQRMRFVRDEAVKDRRVYNMYIDYVFQQN
jgi:hypothetical protein